QHRLDACSPERPHQSTWSNSEDWACDLTTDRAEPMNRIGGEQVQTAALSPDGGRVAMVARDGVRLWSVADGKPEGPPVDAYPAAWSIEFSPNGRRLLIGDQGFLSPAAVLVLDFDTGTLLSLPIHEPSTLA